MQRHALAQEEARDTDGKISDVIRLTIFPGAGIIYVYAQIHIKETAMQNEAEIFKTLGEPTRLRLVTLLAVEGEICVCQLAEALDEPDFKISRHLAILRSAGLVKTRREGTWMHYSLARPKDRLSECLQACLRDCLRDHRTVRQDLRRLAKASCRTTGECRDA